MVIVKLIGGLGNQMFQYAAGRRLAYHHNSTLKLDISGLLDKSKKMNIHRDYDLGIFNIIENIATTRDVQRFHFNRVHSRILKFYFKILQKFNPHYIIKEPHYHFSETVLSAPNNSYLKGYWQSEKYFKDIENIIRNEFTFKSALNVNCKAIKEKIVNENSVCLNVRRTDMVTNPNAHFMGIEYYKRAVQYISERIKNPHFFIFSDDIEWCKVHLKLDHPYTIITHNFAGEKFKDYLQLMILCKHFIIPNSTFSWWAAWLNDNPEKIVLAPVKWFKSSFTSTSDLIPEGWTVT